MGMDYGRVGIWIGVGYIHIEHLMVLIIELASYRKWGCMWVFKGRLGYRVDGRGGVNLDVSADRDSQARVIFFAGG